MKKILSLLIAVMMCAVIFTGCDKKTDVKDAYELYVLANKNSSVENISSLEAKMDMNMRIVAGEEVVDTDIQMDIQAIIVSETDMQMAMTMNMEIPEMGEVPMTMYYKEGYAYTVMMGMKIKIAMPIDQMLESQNLNFASSSDVFAKEDIKEATVTETENGTVLNITLSEEAMMKELSEGGAGSAFAGIADQGAEVKMGEVKMSILLDKDNKIVEQRMIFSIEMEIEGETAMIDYNMTMKEMKYNTITEIAFPEDLEAYMEMAQ